MVRSRNTGWVPQQHGAWAMLICPFALGAAQRVQQGVWSWHVCALFAFWMLGYFAFSAGSWWLKAKRNRDRFRRPLVTYLAATTFAGIITLALGGLGQLGWVPAFLPLALPTLWLVAHRRERSTLSGLLTVAAACLMAVVARHSTPLDAWGDARSWLLFTLSFAYFFGTVPYVKTLIRERGHLSWVVFSVAWHAVATGTVAASAATGQLSWWWTPFFAVTTARAWLVPALGPLRGRTVTPKQAGLGEVVLTCTFATIVLATGL